MFFNPIFEQLYFFRISGHRPDLQTKQLGLIVSRKDHFKPVGFGELLLSAEFQTEPQVRVVNSTRKLPFWLIFKRNSSVRESVLSCTKFLKRTESYGPIKDAEYKKGNIIALNTR